MSEQDERQQEEAPSVVACAGLATAAGTAPSLAGAPEDED